MLGAKLPGDNSNEERPSRRDFLLGIAVASAVAVPVLSAPARAAVSMLRTGLDPDLLETESEIIPAGKGGGGKGKGKGGGGKGRGGKHHGGGGKGKGGGGKGRGGKHHGGKTHGGNGHGHHGHRHGHGGRWWNDRWYPWGGECWLLTPNGWIWICY